ncbi:DNA-binding MurR/RpiR family transcriptional regulator [Herbaspirillum seropedicae]|uniref:MurR/RpiR family transcriptional regulator n=1 Tax=Herbaspirillum seropedicae TaxID=964 RepID=UPI0033987C3D
MTQQQKNISLQGAGAVAQAVGKLYAQLSKSHRKTADYVLGNPFRAATMTIDELSEAAGISVATANRFAHALGFDGYASFRAALVSDFATTLAPVEKLRNEVQRAATSAEIMAAAFDSDIANIEATRRMLTASDCEAAVDMILAAERIFITGFGASAYLAGLMAHALEPYVRTVSSVALAGGPSQAGRQFFKLDNRDLVIPMVFPRYAADTVWLTQRAVEKGARILAITDSPGSPLVPLADVTIYAQTDRKLSPTSDAAALILIQALCDAVAHRARRSVQAASQMAEFVLPWLYLPQQQQRPVVSKAAGRAKSAKTAKDVSTRRKTKA